MRSGVRSPSAPPKPRRSVRSRTAQRSVLVSVPGAVLPARQPDLVPLIGPVRGIDPDRGREVPHGIAGAAPFGPVCGRAMNDSRLVETALVRLKLEVHSIPLIDLIRSDLATKDVRIFAYC